MHLQVINMMTKVYNQLKEATKLFRKSYGAILMGYFNAKIGQGKYELIVVYGIENERDHLV